MDKGQTTAYPISTIAPKRGQVAHLSGNEESRNGPQLDADRSSELAEADEKTEVDFPYQSRYIDPPSVPIKVQLSGRRSVSTDGCWRGARTRYS